MSELPPVVLLYHCIEHEPATDAKMIVPAAVLEEHILTLREMGYEFITAGQLALRWQQGPAPPQTAVITFDDGWRDGLYVATPLLKELQVRATFFVCPGGFGNRIERLGDAGSILTATEAGELCDAGMELGSHTLSHHNLLELSDRELRVEFAESRAAVEQITGEPCLTLAYPTGRHDQRVERVATEVGYQLAFAARRGPWRKFAVPRVQPDATDTSERLIERIELAWREHHTLAE